MKKLTVALLGLGRSGRDIHGNYLHSQPDKYHLAYAVDPLQERRERAAAEYGCEVLEDYTALLDKKDIDLVVNATPSYLHVPLATDFLNHGFNVLVEKPFAQNVRQVDQMIDAAAKNKVTLAPFQQSRFAPYFEQVQKVLASGVLGRVVQITIRFNNYVRRWDWQCCREFGGGSLYNTGPHPLDQALCLLGFPAEMPRVLCAMDRVNTFGDAEDYVKLILTAPGLPLVDLEASSCDAYPPFTYSIMASRGGLKGDLNRVVWRYYVPEEAPPQKLTTTPLHNDEGLPVYCSESLPFHEGAWEVTEAGTFTDATGKLYDSLYDNLVHGKPLAVTPQQVRGQIAIIEECHRQNPKP